uniref:Uncharacterized protein n=1 Tax=Opuntia streptacantha TaxID=393608 RepID=A0A7C9DQT7_OPUST
MGFKKSFGWMSKNKWKCRNLFWRVRAAVEKSVKSNQNGEKKKLRFQYDPFSYALNFDDGAAAIEGGGLRTERVSEDENGSSSANSSCCKLQCFCFLAADDKTWLYVILISV